MREKLRKILLFISIIVFLVSGGMLAKYYYDGWKVEQAFDKLEEKAEYDLASLKEENADTFGWLKVPETNISYPIMFTPNDPEFYLRRNFQKEYNIAGTPFLDGHQDLEHSKHMVFYGHHMKDGSMFKDLLNYDDPEYIKEHDIIEFETVDGQKKKYKVFAYGKTDAAKEGFNVYDYINISDKARFDEYIAGVKALTGVDSGITPTFGDNIVTLSTCSYHSEEGRYIISGVEIED